MVGGGNETTWEMEKKTAAETVTCGDNRTLKMNEKEKVKKMSEFEVM